MLDKPYNVR